MGETSKYHLSYPDLDDPADISTFRDSMLDVEAALDVVTADMIKPALFCTIATDNFPMNGTMMPMTVIMNRGGWVPSGDGFAPPVPGVYVVGGRVAHRNINGGAHTLELVVDKWNMAVIWEQQAFGQYKSMSVERVVSLSPANKLEMRGTGGSGVVAEANGVFSCFWVYAV